MEAKPITLRGLMFPRLSYGRHLFQVAETLYQLNVDFRICPSGGARPDPGDFESIPYSITDRIDWEGKAGVGPEILIAPPETTPRSNNTIFWTSWESSRLTNRQVKALSKAEVVITPSSWCSEVIADNLRDAHIDGQIDSPPPVRTASLGIDPTIYYPWIRRVGWDIRFLTGGHYKGSGLRKRLDYAIRLFQTAFPADSDPQQVSLTVKVTPDSDIQRLKDQIGTDSRIDIISSYIGDEQMAELYRQCDCFINCSNGEGFGLMLLEAMACGTPVVSTDLTGPGDFLSHAWSYIVDGRLEPSTDHYYPGSIESPKLWPILRKLRDACYVPRERYRKAARGVVRAREESWIASTLEVLSCIEELNGDHAIRYSIPDSD